MWLVVWFYVYNVFCICRVFIGYLFVLFKEIINLWFVIWFVFIDWCFLNVLMNLVVMFWWWLLLKGFKVVWFYLECMNEFM